MECWVECGECAECGMKYESAGCSNEMKRVKSKEVKVVRLVFMKEQKDRGMTVVW